MIMAIADDKQLMVSIIIPCYNIEQYIGETLQSLINQSSQNFEVICVNDGSKDNTLEVLNKYAEDYGIIKVYNQPNAGVSVARNNGIAHAKGKYISFLDGDDLLHPNFIQNVLVLAEKNGWPDLINCGYCNLSENSFDQVLNREMPLSVFHNSDEFFKNYDKLDYYVNSIGSKLYKREIIIDNHIKFDVNIKNMEDMAFNLDFFSYVNSGVIHNVPYYNYRIRENSAIHRMTLPKYIERTYNHQIDFMNRIGERRANYLLNNSNVFVYYFWRHSIMYKALFLVSEAKNLFVAKKTIKEFSVKNVSVKMVVNKLMGRNRTDKVFLYLLRHQYYFIFCELAKLKYCLSNNAKLFNILKNIMNR